MPIRVQRKRTKGFKLPPNTVCVGRGTHWGNLLVVGRTYTMDDDGMCAWITAGEKAPDGAFTIENNADAVYWFREKLRRQGLLRQHYHWNDLVGMNLACWCPLDQPCHADVLLEVANQP